LEGGIYKSLLCNVHDTGTLHAPGKLKHACVCRVQKSVEEIPLVSLTLIKTARIIERVSSDMQSKWPS